MWKTRFGRRIYQDDQGITVYQNLLYRWLTLGSSAIQTLIPRYRFLQKGLDYIPAITFAARTMPGSCCLLGLGGAGVAHALHPYLGKHKLIAVENNPSVINVANTCFKADTLSSLTIVHQDANLFVKTANETFQHVLVDLFDKEAFPAACFNRDFFAHCKRLLTATGTLSVNIANVHEHQPILQLIKEQFNHALCSIPIPKTANVIVLASNQGSVLPLLQQYPVKQCIWSDDWGYLVRF